MKEDTNSDGQDTNADKGHFDDLLFPSLWARLAYRTLQRFRKTDLLDLEQFGYSEQRLFDNATVAFKVWLHINSVGMDALSRYEVELAKSVTYASEPNAAKAARESQTVREAIVMLSLVAKKIDDGVEVRVIDDGDHVYFHCHYEHLPDDLLPCWCPSSAMIPYTLVKSMCGFNPDTLIGFTYPRENTRYTFDREDAYSEAIYPARFIFDFPAPDYPLRGYFIRWSKKDIDQRSVLFMGESVDRGVYRIKTSDRVMSLLRENMKRMTAQQVAAKLEMSDRELRRKLKSEGASFQDLYDKHLTLLIASPKFSKMSGSQAAEILGYGSASSLRRAVTAAKK